MTWIADNSPGILAAVAAFMSWQKSRQNGQRIDTVHETINGNRTADLARAAAAGHDAGVISERDHVAAEAAAIIAEAERAARGRG